MNEKTSNKKTQKLKIIFLTLFPEYIENYFEFSIQKKAKEIGLLEIEIHNIRDYAEKDIVDDYQYGGGKGMVIKIEPIVKAIRKIKEKNDPYVLNLNPQGKIFKQTDVKRLIEKKCLIFICGRYEGIDKRISNYIDEEISVGEFITMGGEIPSLLISESLIRGIPGVIKNESFREESFSENKFDYDCYTRPENFEGFEVPKVLLSGNHKKIKEWRKSNSLQKEKNNK